MPEEKAKPFSTLPGPAQIDAVLAVQAELDQPGAWEGTLIADPGRMPYFEYTPAVERLLDALRGGGFIQAFDWPAWSSQVQAYLDDPPLLESASLEDLCKLCTAHIRADRFVEGHLNHMAVSGHLQAILNRLAVLRKEMDVDPR